MNPARVTSAMGGLGLALPRRNDRTADQSDEAVALGLP